jgi:tRNA modification GTPase
MLAADTIAAISSPSGEGGIGVIRISGSHSHFILKKIFRPRKQTRTLVSHSLCLGFIFDPSSGTDVDEVFATIMEEPRTYTREKMAEIFCHGGIAPQRRILGIVLENGARIAQAGEFTKRAYLNGRIDLAQAESVLDIIESQTARELETALAHVKGQLSQALTTIRNEVISLLSEVEADIDFPEEELAIEKSGWSSRLASVRTGLSSLVLSYYEGRAIKEGIQVLIVGRTNVGKSSLLNALVLSDKAIVTPLPGTTRDLVEDTIVVKGIKLRITDTAGLRESVDPVERAGIEKAKMRIRQADIVLWVVDSSAPYSSEDELAYREICDKQIIAVLNKTDLSPNLQDEIVREKGIKHVRRVSALTGLGMSELKAVLYELFETEGHPSSDVVITSVRQKALLEEAEAAVTRAGATIISGSPIEIAALELRAALACLSDIAGETCTDDVLDEIFSRFCIGK